VKRLFLVAGLAMLAALATPAAASATVNCTISTVGVDGYFNAGDTNPPYFFVGESNEHATCTGGAWYETSQVIVETSPGHEVPEHCGSQGSVCYRTRPTNTNFAAGSKNWCSVTNPPNDPDNDFGAPCSFKSVDQNPCSIPMQLSITVWDAATLLPVTVKDSDWICKTG
jgi:hypothetical protein